MKTLFISTFHNFVVIGLLKDGKVLVEKEISSNQSHSIHLIPTIEEVLKSQNILIEETSSIIVINGPGSFTGVRLGVTVAKTLAFTLNIEIKTITSIEAIALSSDVSKKIVLVPDAKGAYYGIFENNILCDDIKYLNTIELESFLKSKEEYKVIDDVKLNLVLIYDYLKNKNSTNAHSVNPIYIKNIEVLNGN